MRWSFWSFSWVNSVHCSRCVCVCVCVCVSTAPDVCVLGWVKYREHISLLVILCIVVYVKKNKLFFFIMVKCLNIGKNIGKAIYRSISSSLLVCGCLSVENAGIDQHRVAQLQCWRAVSHRIDLWMLAHVAYHTHTHTHTHTAIIHFCQML